MLRLFSDIWPGWKKKNRERAIDMNLNSLFFTLEDGFTY